MSEPLVGNQYLLDTLALVYILYSFYLMPTICHLSRRCCRFMRVRDVFCMFAFDVSSQLNTNELAICHLIQDA